MYIYVKQESRAAIREPRDAAAVIFWFKVRQEIHWLWLSLRVAKLQLLKARLRSSKHIGAKQHLTQNGDYSLDRVSGKAMKEPPHRYATDWNTALCQPLRSIAASRGKNSRM